MSKLGTILFFVYFLPWGGGGGKETLFFWASIEDGLSTLQKTAYEKISIQTCKTSQHPKTRKTQGDKTTCDDQPQGPPSNIKSHQSSPIKIIYKPTFSKDSHKFRLSKSCHMALETIKYG